jgi:hypothetical protein
MGKWGGGMTIEIGLMIAIVGCFIGLAGWLSGRDKKIGSDGEWRGSVNTKLDTIHNDITGVCGDIKEIKATLGQHGERLTAVEESAKSAHIRISEIGGGV